MNLAIIIAVMLAVAGAGWQGFRLGVDHEIASQHREDQHVAEAVDAATTVAADAIAKLRPKYTTIKNEVEREIRTNTVYADCHNTPDVMRKLNEALSPPSRPASASEGVVSGAVPTP